LMQANLDRPAIAQKLSEACASISEICLQKAQTSYDRARRLNPDNPILNRSDSLLQSWVASVGQTASQKSTLTGGTSVEASTPAPRLKAAVVSWDMTHNPVGRAYLLADMVQRNYDVELVGPIFPFYGKELWPPLKNVRMKTRTFVAESLAAFVRGAKQLAQAQTYDYVYISKPRFPSLLIGMLIKYYSKCPLILDIDDGELSFFKNRTPAAWNELLEKVDTEEWRKPYSEIWTRFAENLIPLADAVTVSNIALQEQYGGQIVRHARNEEIFDPKLYQRQETRSQFGYSQTDKVILFLGTPRPHKGIFEIAQALDTLDDSRFVFCIIGKINDKRVSSRFASYKNARIDFHDNQPWERLPELVGMADLVCILQDPNSPIADHQIPAKLTDAMSMNVPVLATAVPPLMDLIAAKAIIPVEPANLAQTIQAVLDNPIDLQFQADRNRGYFLSEFSYNINAERIRTSFELSRENVKPQSKLFADVCQLLARESKIELPEIEFSTAAEATSAAVRYRRSQSTSPRQKSNQKSTSIDKNQPFDIIFFWKQNDSDIYGRRQDAIVKYLAQSDRVNRIIHFDAPISAQKLQEQVQYGSKSKFHQGNLVFTHTVERFLSLKDTKKIIRRTFVYGEGNTERIFLGRSLPKKSDYIHFVRSVLHELKISHNTIAWVCPVCFEFPELADEFKFPFVIADLIDDQRQWTIKPSYEAKLNQNYRSTLEKADLAFTNCEPVREAFSEFHDDITVVPNGAEVFDDLQSCAKPSELESLQGPIVGYVGNLSDRIDMDLLRYIAIQKPNWNLVIIGSAHGSSQIFELEELSNIHLLGVKKYDEAVKFIQHFDVAIIPHLANELTRSMNPLKLYVYYAIGVPIVTSEIPNIEEFSGNIHVASNHPDFVKCIERSIDRGHVPPDRRSQDKLLQKIDWRTRISTIFTKLDARLSNCNYIGDREPRWKVESRSENMTSSTIDSTLNSNSHSQIAKMTQTNTTQPQPATTQKASPQTTTQEEPSYHGSCAVCGEEQTFYKKHRSLREGYQCRKCKASLRYQGQADAIVKKFSKMNAVSLEALSREEVFQTLSIYEPGVIGPFRKYFEKFP
ncbi:MAG: glycosyltransferase, partial [Cyanobacteriota bacterium]|nr:glycosyltransferase [Cyanobacteriota bacterium]